MVKKAQGFSLALSKQSFQTEDSFISLCSCINKIIFRASETAQQVMALPCKTKDPSSFPGPTGWKERIDSHKLLFLPRVHYMCVTTNVHQLTTCKNRTPEFSALGDCNTRSVSAGFLVMTATPQTLKCNLTPTPCLRLHLQPLSSSHIPSSLTGSFSFS